MLTYMDSLVCSSVQQHAVRHVLDVGGGASAVLKANGVADLQQRGEAAREGQGGHR
jgi:beta-lactamase superfamily II metal-dependent hydrolase